MTTGEARSRPPSHFPDLLFDSSKTAARDRVDSADSRPDTARFAASGPEDPPPVDEAVAKAAVLIEALAYIRQFRDRYVVIKLGGSALDGMLQGGQPESVRRCLQDVVFMSTVGMRPILVHGGGKAISRALQSEGVETRFVHGRRVTDEAVLKVASRTLSSIADSLADEIVTLGGRAVALHAETENALIGRKIDVQTPEGPIDLGRVGEVTDLRRDTLVVACRSGAIPVVPSIAADADHAGRLLNVNADTAAAAVARLMNVEKLAFLSDVPGILTDRDDPSTLISHIDRGQCRSLIADGTIAAGMIPKVEASLDALDAGVRKVHMVDAGMPHSLLVEIFSNTGVGTEIVR